MDYESKILLNRLVDEVEKLNSPDWWVIGITVVNALVVAWLAWRQYQLQKQQVKFQEYEIYKELFLFVKDIYDISNSFLSDEFIRQIISIFLLIILYSFIFFKN